MDRNSVQIYNINEFYLWHVNDCVLVPVVFVGGYDELGGLVFDPRTQSQFYVEYNHLYDYNSSNLTRGD